MMSRALRCNWAHLKSLNVGGIVDKGQSKGTQHVNLVQIIAQVNSDPSQSGLWGNGCISTLDGQGVLHFTYQPRQQQQLESKGFHAEQNQISATGVGLCAEQTGTVVQ